MKITVVLAAIMAAISITSCSAEGKAIPAPITEHELYDQYARITGKIGSMAMLKEQAKFYCDPDKYWGSVDRAMQAAFRVWGQKATEVLDVFWSYGCPELKVGVDELEQK